MLFAKKVPKEGIFRSLQVLFHPKRAETEKVANPGPICPKLATQSPPNLLTRSALPNQCPTKAFKQIAAD